MAPSSEDIEKWSVVPWDSSNRVISTVTEPKIQSVEVYFAYKRTLHTSKEEEVYHMSALCSKFTEFNFLTSTIWSFQCY